MNILLYMQEHFLVRRAVDVSKPAKVNTLYIYLELLSFFHTYLKLFQNVLLLFNDFREANIYLYSRHWKYGKYGRNMTMVDLVCFAYFTKVS